MSVRGAPTPPHQVLWGPNDLFMESVQHMVWHTGSTRETCASTNLFNRGPLSASILCLLIPLGFCPPIFPGRMWPSVNAAMTEGEYGNQLSPGWRGYTGNIHSCPMRKTLTMATKTSSKHMRRPADVAFKTRNGAFFSKCRAFTGPRK